MRVLRPARIIGSASLALVLLSGGFAVAGDVTRCPAGWTIDTPPDLASSDIQGVVADDRGRALVVGIEQDDEFGTTGAVVSVMWEPGVGWDPAVRMPLAPLDPGVSFRHAGNAVLAGYPDDAWFLWNEASPLVDISDAAQAHVAHWDGVEWTDVSPPSDGTVRDGEGLDVDGGGTVWMVVNRYDPLTERPRSPQVLRWSPFDDAGWTVLDPLPRLPPGRNVVEDVAAVRGVPWVATLTHDDLFAWMDGRWRVFDVAHLSNRELNVTGVGSAGSRLVMTLTEGGASSHGMAYVHDSRGWVRLGAGLPDDYGYLADAGGKGLGSLWAWGSNDSFLFERARWRRLVPPQHRSLRAGSVGVSMVTPTTTGALAVGGDERGSALYRICSWPIGDPDADGSLLTARPTSPEVLMRVPPIAGGGRVRDLSPLRLFDSGPLPAGARFVAAYPGAGTYPFDDGSVTPRRIVVPMDVWAAPAGSGEPIRARWGKDGYHPDSPWRWDLEVRGPSDSDFRPWLFGTDERQGTFAPDEGPGTYTFRARSVDSLSAISSDWSPPRSTVVA
jgi:hypothetical protein